MNFFIAISTSWAKSQIALFIAAPIGIQIAIAVAIMITLIGISFAIYKYYKKPSVLAQKLENNEKPSNLYIQKNKKEKKQENKEPLNNSLATTYLMKAISSDQFDQMSTEIRTELLDLKKATAVFFLLETKKVFFEQLINISLEIRTELLDNAAYAAYVLKELKFSFNALIELDTKDRKTLLRDPTSYESEVIIENIEKKRRPLSASP